MSTSAPPSPPAPARPRFTRIARTPERTGASPTPPTPCALPADSLAWQLLLAARAIAAVRAGRSLTEGLQACGGEPPATRAAVTDIAYGTLRRYGWGDFMLGRLLQKALPHPEAHALLLAALHRLETWPEDRHTVVDQAVAAAGEIAGGAFRGLVNGVLRNYLRQHDALAAAAADDVVAAWQHPRWWIDKLRRAWPADWQAVLAAGNAPPPMTLRVNRRLAAPADYRARLAALGIEARPLGESGLRLVRPVAVDALPDFATGAVSVQDAGAQRAAELLDPAPGSRVLDACAAPGGKTAHLLERGENLDLLALDIDGVRTARIEDTLRRLGLRASVCVADCADVDAWWDGRPFDAILADVPCSASGVVRRHPDSKWLRRESDIRRFARTQAAILDALWPLLRPGGRLLYATCSVFPEENAGQVDAFRVRQPGAVRLHETQLLPCDDHDGFYYALLQKSA